MSFLAEKSTNQVSQTELISHVNKSQQVDTDELLQMDIEKMRQISDIISRLRNVLDPILLKTVENGLKELCVQDQKMSTKQLSRSSTVEFSDDLPQSPEDKSQQVDFELLYTEKKTTISRILSPLQNLLEPDIFQSVKLEMQNCVEDETDSRPEPDAKANIEQTCSQSFNADVDETDFKTISKQSQSKDQLAEDDAPEVMEELLELQKENTELASQIISPLKDIVPSEIWEAIQGTIEDTAIQGSIESANAKDHSCSQIESSSEIRDAKNPEASDFSTFVIPHELLDALPDELIDTLSHGIEDFVHSPEQDNLVPKDTKPMGQDAILVKPKGFFLTEVDQDDQEHDDQDHDDQDHESQEKSTTIEYSKIDEEKDEDKDILESQELFIKEPNTSDDKTDEISKKDKKGGKRNKKSKTDKSDDDIEIHKDEIVLTEESHEDSVQDETSPRSPQQKDFETSETSSKFEVVTAAEELSKIDTYEQPIASYYTGISSESILDDKFAMKSEVDQPIEKYESVTSEREIFQKHDIEIEKASQVAGEIGSETTQEDLLPSSSKNSFEIDADAAREITSEMDTDEVKHIVHEPTNSKKKDSLRRNTALEENATMNESKERSCRQTRWAESKSYSFNVNEEQHHGNEVKVKLGTKIEEEWMNESNEECQQFDTKNQSESNESNTVAQQFQLDSSNKTEVATQNSTLENNFADSKNIDATEVTSDDKQTEESQASSILETLPFKQKMEVVEEDTTSEVTKLSTAVAVAAAQDKKRRKKRKRTTADKDVGYTTSNITQHDTSMESVDVVDSGNDATETLDEGQSSNEDSYRLSELLTWITQMHARLDELRQKILANEGASRQKELVKLLQDFEQHKHLFHHLNAQSQGKVLTPCKSYIGAKKPRGGGG
jgi:hypothetical protein